METPVLGNFLLQSTFLFSFVSLISTVRRRTRRIGNNRLSIISRRVCAGSGFRRPKMRSPCDYGFPLSHSYRGRSECLSLQRINSGVLFQFGLVSGAYESSLVCFWHFVRLSRPPVPRAAFILAFSDNVRCEKKRRKSLDRMLNVECHEGGGERKSEKERKYNI